MKSIVEQASTVLKAIEKGWVQAGKPCEFTVKVYEHGVKNFFGMSVEPAKICILFEDKPSKNTVAPTQHQPNRQDSHVKQHANSHQQQHTQRQQAVVLQRPQKELPEKALLPQPTKIIWSDELIDACNKWLTTTLAVMGKGDCTFTIEAKKYHLIITFSQAVLDDQEREKALFRSFAHVLMQSLRNRFKKGLRGYRIVLNTSQA